ncbi:MAG: ABC transporter permease subunit [Myxococcota bacterium]|jgi:phosphonate transport system permease protein|nr:ABC transporter permease subunit [Myxococcota bacterium]
MAADGIRTPNPVGVRVILITSGVVACALAWGALGLGLSDLVPTSGGLSLAGRFFARAFSPAWQSEARFVPDGTPPLLEVAFEATLQTLILGAAAMSLALVLGLALGFAASSAWWSGAGPESRRGVYGMLRRSFLPFLCGASRLLIVVMRSVHELLWAVLFLAAVGLNDLAAVFALAIPYGGVLAKIFSELVDEAPRESARSLRGLGASGLQTYWFALIPRALPDMVAYGFYRFECILRSSAVLGFFGFPTLGLYIRQSFNATNYGEVWTFLYALLILVVAADAWSGAVRKRVLA